MTNHVLTMIATTVLVASSSLAQNSSLRWSDDLESYPQGQMAVSPPQGINPITSGGWDGWDGDPAVLGDIVPNPSGSGQALEITANDDHLWNFTLNLASNGSHDTGRGTWVFEIDAYFPATTTGRSWYIIQNDYAHFGPYNWSVQIAMDGSTGMIMADYGANQCAQAPLPNDRWFTFRTEVFLDPASTAAGKGWTRTWILDNNNPGGPVKTLLATCATGTADPRLGEGYNWVDGVFGGATNNGFLQFENLDLYGDPGLGGPMYYDNPRCYEKPDLLHISAPGTTAGGVPYIDCTVGGTAGLLCNGTYQDEGDVCLILAGFNGSTPGFPLAGPGGSTTVLPINLPDPLFEYMLQSPNAAAWPNNIETLGEYGAKPNAMQFIIPPAPYLQGSGFTLSFGAVVWDTADPAGGIPTLTFRWADGASLQFD